MHARRDAGAERLPLPGRRTSCSTSTSCPSSSGGCACSRSTARNARHAPRRATTSTASAAQGRPCCGFAGDPAIERVLMLDPAPRARLRLQPGHRSTGATAPTARSPAWSPSSTTPSASGCPSCCAGRALRYEHDEAAARLAVLRPRPALRVRVLAAGRRGLGAHPRARGRRRAPLDRGAARPPRASSRTATLARDARPLPAACRCR